MISYPSSSLNIQEMRWSLPSLRCLAWNCFIWERCLVWRLSLPRDSSRFVDLPGDPSHHRDRQYGDGRNREHRAVMTPTPRWPQILLPAFSCHSQQCTALRKLHRIEPLCKPPLFHSTSKRVSVQQCYTMYHSCHVNPSSGLVRVGSRRYSSHFLAFIYVCDLFSAELKKKLFEILIQNDQS